LKLQLGKNSQPVTLATFHAATTEALKDTPPPNFPVEYLETLALIYLSSKRVCFQIKQKREEMVGVFGMPICYNSA